MSFKINVEGHKEEINYMEDMISGLDPKVFSYWAEIVEKTAGEECIDLEGNRIRFKAAKMNIEIKLQDKRAKDCIIKAIRKQLPQMPVTLQPIYEQLIKELESKEKEKSD